MKSIIGDITAKIGDVPPNVGKINRNNIIALVVIKKFLNYITLFLFYFLCYLLQGSISNLL